MKTTAEVLMKPGEATLVELGEAIVRCWSAMGNAEETNDRHTAWAKLFNAGMAELHRRDLHAQDMESALEMACADLNTSGEHGGPVFAGGSIAEHYISWATAAREYLEYGPEN
jgi:hypothetical protein